MMCMGSDPGRLAAEHQCRTAPDSGQMRRRLAGLQAGGISVMISIIPATISAIPKRPYLEAVMRAWFRLFLVGALALQVTPALAAEKLRVGKAVGFAWTFTPIEVGIETGQFAKQGIELEVSAFGGDAKM